jgi:hypothetical protein
MNDANKVDMSAAEVADATKVEDQEYSGTTKSPEGMQKYNLEN